MVLKVLSQVIRKSDKIGILEYYRLENHSAISAFSE